MKPMNPDPTPKLPFKSSDYLPAISEPTDLEPSSLDEVYRQAALEIWNNPIFPDKKLALDALIEGQTEKVNPSTEPENAALLKLRIPDRHYPPEVVWAGAVKLVRGRRTAEDWESAIAEVYRSLDIAHRISDRHKLEEASEPETMVSFDEAMMEITGAERPGKAEERFVSQMLTRGSMYIDHKEVKQASGSKVEIHYGMEQMTSSKVPEGHDPDVRGVIEVHQMTEKEIKAALAPYRENGFSQRHMKRLCAQYAEISKRMRSQGAQKARQKKKPK
jgi:hypothetical protein